MSFHPVENAAVTSGGEFSPRRYRFSLLTVCATFLLIVAGGLVTSNQAGDSVPDWPLNFGQVVPWEQFVGNVRFEYGHRVIATTVGLLTIILNLLFWRDEKRPWVRKLGLLALVAVILQGLLGGVRVLLLEYRVPVAIIHACLAQTFFSLIIGLTVFTSPQWFDIAKSKIQDQDDKLSLAISLCTTAVAAIFLQLLLGAAFRHRWIGIIPHIIGAVLVTILLGWTLITVLRNIQSVHLTRPAMCTLGLLVIQLALGITAYFARISSYDDPQPLLYMVSLTVAHVAGGALTLAMAVVILLRLHRIRLQISDFRLQTPNPSQMIQGLKAQS